MTSKQRILDTVGLWGTPINKFRVFKVRGVWHIVWPNEAFAKKYTDNYPVALRTVRRAIAEA